MSGELGRVGPLDGRVVGFCIASGLSLEERTILSERISKFLGQFAWLKQVSFNVDTSVIHLWGTGDLSKCVCRDSETFAFVTGLVQARSLQLDGAKGLADSVSELGDLPNGGRLILVRLESSGGRWQVVNDWLGSIPVFYGERFGRRVLGTIEPLVSSTLAVSSTDLFGPGLVCLLLNGHYVADWTLYKNVKTLLPDSLLDWSEEKLTLKSLNTVVPSTLRWECSWRDLLEEGHSLLLDCLRSSCQSGSSWSLPISGGLDSRILAGMARRLEIPCRSFSYGNPSGADFIFGRKVAESLSLKWEGFPIEASFLEQFTPVWLSWFGASLHCHGMYLLSVLSARKETTSSFISGFLGDAVAGSHIEFLEEGRASVADSCYLMRQKAFWDEVSIRRCLKIASFESSLDFLREQLALEVKRVDGARFQQLMFADLWNRQRLFVSFQLTLYDYHGGVVAPYMSPRIARFWLSLPRCALDDRRLQKDILKSFYPNLAALEGTYADEPLKLRASYLVRRRIFRWLTRVGIPPGLVGSNPPQSEHFLRIVSREALKQKGKRSLFPFWSGLDISAIFELIEKKDLETQAALAIRGDDRALARLQVLQAVASVMVRNDPTFWTRV